MKHESSVVRRRLLSFMGLFPFFSSQEYIGKKLSIAPCSFPFDASHKGNFLYEKFNIVIHRNYIFTLEFHHHGGLEASNLSNLLDAEYGLYIASSMNSNNPIRVSDEYFMEKKYFTSIKEEGDPLTEANKKYTKAMHAAIDSKNINTEFVWMPRNLNGMIPIKISIIKMELNGSNSIIANESIDTLGTFAGGNGRFDRQITVEELRPGTYEIHAETIHDSPLFFDTPIRLGITYHSNTKLLKY